MKTFAEKFRHEQHPAERQLLDTCQRLVFPNQADAHPQTVRALASESFGRLLSLNAEHDADFVRVLQMRAAIRDRELTEQQHHALSFDPMKGNEVERALQHLRSHFERDSTAPWSCERVAPRVYRQGHFVDGSQVGYYCDAFSIRVSPASSPNAFTIEVHEMTHTGIPFHVGAALFATTGEPDRRWGRSHDFYDTESRIWFDNRTSDEVAVICSKLLQAVVESPRDAHLIQEAKSKPDDAFFKPSFRDGQFVHGSICCSLKWFELAEGARIAAMHLRPPCYGLTKLLLRGEITDAEYRVEHVRDEDLRMLERALGELGQPAIWLREAPHFPASPKIVDVLLRASNNRLIVTKDPVRNVATLSSDPATLPEGTFLYTPRNEGWVQQLATFVKANAPTVQDK